MIVSGIPASKEVDAQTQNNATAIKINQRHYSAAMLCSYTPLKGKFLPL